MRLRLLQLVLPVAVLTFLTMGFNSTSLAHDDKYEARQHGYDHGYRDGYHQGHEAQDRHRPYNLETEDYKHGDRGYEKYMGDHGQYKDGYRTGYQSGYDDAYYKRAGRFGEIYGRRYLEDDRDRDFVPYRDHPEGNPDVAYDVGYADGVRSGEKDLRDHHRFDPTDKDRYRDGDHGYQSSYGDKERYKDYYRDGFRHGYEDAFGR
jgi:hypothetical protein